MEIIPVIDIYRGRVVHALKGQRSSYQPIQSGLCSGSDPVDIVQAFLDVYPFKKIYIADLDAINGLQINNKIINTLCVQFPGISFWIDEGNSSKDEIAVIQDLQKVQVVGSETGIGPDVMNDLKTILPQPVLSLDFRNGNFIGNKTMLLSPENWPENVIIMNLDRVGSEEGPDMELFKKITSMAKDKNFYIAGGIRNIDDIQSLKETGITGILLATALHNEEITGKELREIGTKNI